MQIQVNTGSGVESNDAFERWATDENRDKGGGGDKRCVMEARVAGHAPVAVTQHAPNLDEAFRGANDKLKRALDSILARHDRHRDRESIRKDGDAPGE